jgi:hypothetical protein
LINKWARKEDGVIGKHRLIQYHDRLRTYCSFYNLRVEGEIDKCVEIAGTSEG